MSSHNLEKPSDNLFSPKDSGDVSFGEYEDKEKKFGYYDLLKEELKTQKEGGVDIHFSQIDIDNLSNQVLDLYRLYKQEKLSEHDVKEFREKNKRLSKDEVNFVAMILNWTIAKDIEKKLKKAA